MATPSFYWPLGLLPLASSYLVWERGITAQSTLKVIYFCSKKTLVLFEKPAAHVSWKVTRRQKYILSHRANFRCSKMSLWCLLPKWPFLHLMGNPVNLIYNYCWSIWSRIVNIGAVGSLFHINLPSPHPRHRNNKVASRERGNDGQCQHPLADEEDKVSSNHMPGKQ